jgi:6-phosphogluconolactonase
VSGGPVLEVAESGEALPAIAAQRMASMAEAAVGWRGKAALALSGGSTPALMFEELARYILPWERIHLFQVDERVAPEGGPDRNATLLRANLVDQVPIPAANVHLMPVEAPDLAAGARAYAAELAEVTGDGVLDVVHLGLGDDGHTASWPPGDPVLDVTDEDVAVVGPFRGRLRMTLTPPAVNRARAVLWLVDGTDKAPALRRLLDGDRSLPASAVRTDRAVVMAGPAAAPDRGRPGGG